MRKWTEHDKTALCELYPTVSQQELIVKFGRNWSAITRQASNLGVKRKLGRPKGCVLNELKLFGRVPSRAELSKLGRHDLRHAISNHGGYTYFRKHLMRS